MTMSLQTAPKPPIAMPAPLTPVSSTAVKRRMRRLIDDDEVDIVPTGQRRRGEGGRGRWHEHKVERRDVRRDDTLRHIRDDPLAPMWSQSGNSEHSE